MWAYPGTPVESLVARTLRAPEIPAQLGTGWVSLLTAMTAMDPEARPSAVAAHKLAARLSRPDAAPAPPGRLRRSPEGSKARLQARPRRPRARRRPSAWIAWGFQDLLTAASVERDDAMESRATPRPELVGRLRAAGCVFAEDEAGLLEAAAAAGAELDGLVRQRASGLPLEHVLGWAEFCGLRIAGGPRGLRATPPDRVPRQVRGRGSYARRPAPRWPVVVDLCCGSGAVGAALAAAAGPLELHAADVDPAAAACARRNLLPLGGEVHEGDLFDPLPAAPRPGGSRGGQCAVRSLGNDRHHAAGGAPARTAGFASTAAPTGWSCSGGSPPGRQCGWRRAAIC